MQTALQNTLFTSTEESFPQIDLIEIGTPYNSPIGQAVSKQNGTSERWGLHNYDLSKVDQFDKAKRAILTLRPRHLWCSPPTTPFLNQRTRQDRENLTAPEKKSKEYKKAKLVWDRCITLANLQISSGRHAHIEHPLRSRAWKLQSEAQRHFFTTTRPTRIDGCMHDCRDSSGNLALCPIQVYTSDSELATSLQTLCNHGRPHSANTHGENRYSKQLGNHIAKSVLKEPTQIVNKFWKTVFQNQSNIATYLMEPSTVCSNCEEIDESEDLLGYPSTVYNPPEDEEESETMRNLIIIHRNLGHPSNKLLQRILREADAPRDVIAMAGELECPLCHRFRQIEPARPSTSAHARQFNETLCIDMAYHNIKRRSKSIGNPLCR